MSRPRWHPSAGQSDLTGTPSLLSQSENSRRNGCGNGRRTQPVLGLCIGLGCLADHLGFPRDLSWIFLRSFVNV
jgi:hypothetical protein